MYVEYVATRVVRKSDSDAKLIARGVSYINRIKDVPVFISPRGLCQEVSGEAGNFCSVVVEGSHVTRISTPVSALVRIVMGVLLTLTPVGIGAVKVEETA
jgi:hypothetical protein